MSEHRLNGAYVPKTIEKKWQAYWAKHKTFKTPELPDKPKYYVLDMFPYPSGSGLHVGHPEGYTATDITARYKRKMGYCVLHPMGWDAFGLPAEQYAIKTGTHPRITTDQNIKTFKEQIIALGLSYDWDREIDTTSVDYIKWTQWIFLQLEKKGLAYQSFAPVNWCPELGTVLANEEVIDGKSEVGGFEVIKKPIRQWVLKITEYAERLLADLEDLDWPESIKMQQRNWIGKSTGADIDFKVQGTEQKIRVFSTRPDTLFGATFMVLAPEHELVEKITSAKQKNEVTDYVNATLRKSERDRQASTEKTGVFIGAYGINPVNGEAIPIYIADYVLSSYGHGAIMAVPAHDERDHAFAKKYGLDIKQVLNGEKESIENEAHTGTGTLINSEFLDNLNKNDAIESITKWLAKNSHGEKKINFKLRDWLFSRQRYWGEPIPVLHAEDGSYITDENIPIVLPELDDFKPSGDGESPLSKSGEWLAVEKDGKKYKRETNTMPQWAGSCWYYLRFIDPTNDNKAISKEKADAWLPVDLYVGGAEHAVLHLLYARFWHKVLYDLGYVSTKEPFQKLVNQGMILGENGEKMSKSRGNVVNPDDVIAEWGADSMRLYEMFMGPLTATKPWQTSGISGVSRFLNRVWRLIVDEESGELNSRIVKISENENLKTSLHQTISKVTNDIESMSYNTAISSMMEFTNACYKEESIPIDYVRSFVQLLSPFAPHMCEELWERLGASESIEYIAWPKFDSTLLKSNTFIIPVQINGKVRDQIEIEEGAIKEDVISLAKNRPAIAKHINGKTVRKEIYVAKKIINFVVT